MLPRTTSKNPAVLSYYTMRRAVGLMALTLPFMLAVGSILASLLGPNHALPHPLLQRSISDYYYTPMRNFYVGVLCAIGAFLACSRGYDVYDEITGYLAGAFAFGVAFFPSFDPRSGHYTLIEMQIGFIHTTFAALMFLILGGICIFLFRKSSPEKPFTRRKRNRNRIYGACGLVLVVCVVLMVILTARSAIEQRHPSHWLFWCESFALGAFGVAWLTKGEGILRDRAHNHNHVGTQRPPLVSS
jgi:surface polysaccharide O-acyltransferase-like enzyme